MRGEAPRASAIGAIDVVGIIVAALGILAIVAVQVFVVPSFADMFRDFGGPLPSLTRLLLGWVVVSIAILVTAVLAGIGIALRVTGRGVGTVAIGAAAFVPALTLPLMLYAMYLPIFEIAGAIE